MSEIEKEIKAEHEYIALKVKEAEARGYARAIEMLKSDHAPRGMQGPYPYNDNWADWLSDNNPYKKD